MPILDTEKILNGTDSKQLIHAYENMKTQYSDELARDYRSYYIGKPLSFLMKNARYIVPEPQFGLPFMKWVALSFPNPFTHLINLKSCIENYVADTAGKMNPGLSKLYADVIDELSNAIKSRSSEGAVEMSKIGSDVRNDFFDICYSELCKRRIACNDESMIKYFNDCSPYESPVNFSDYMRSCPNMMKAVYLTPYAKELCMESEVCESFCDMIIEDAEGSEAKASNLIACETVQTLALSQRFLESVNRSTNLGLRTITHGMIRADIPNELITSFKEAVDDTINPVYSDTKSAVNAIMTESVFDNLYKEDRIKTRNELLSLKKEVYESVREFVYNHYIILEEADIMPETALFTAIKESMGVECPLTVDDALKLITEASSEVEFDKRYFFEAVGDGSANKVIKKHNVMYREDETTKGRNAKPVERKNVEDDDILDDEDETDLPESTRVASKDLPDSSNPNATKKPSKPKQGVLSSVQNKALDVHSKSRQTGAKLRQVGTAVKNAGKAVLKIPAGTVEGMKNLVRTFDEMDDNRRKEYMLQPGYRKKIFKNIRVAVTYGLAAQVSALMIPVVWFGRSLSKEKNKRIRNEFARELETEIKVCEAKIEDARADGNQKQCYQLMRIRDQYARQRERVLVNGKYI